MNATACRPLTIILLLAALATAGAVLLARSATVAGAAAGERTSVLDAVTGANG